MPLQRIIAPTLVLEPLSDAHEALHRALYTSPRVMARIAEPLDEEAARAAFHAAVAANRREPPRQRTWAVVEPGPARAIGIGALFDRASDTELGLMLLPAAWNARHSHEVIDALVAHAFDRLGIARLTGICRAGANERMSRRLLLPHGFVDATPDRPGTARWVLDRGAWARPVGTGRADR